ncbi:DUF512 domain-containing protein [Caloramator proteoclasticus]|uniref:Putative radical SAM enzyme, TIGR03279 family n=1 Tax=Caloramator proteoclasticus DSM 10124 TaxID=1121262 RepID=A0A1M4UF44_9CLOT|nr:DUF512 domain-containing protein [Caloramator proteoclasticus]SHE55379.1 putative radical SAM enzyme, TIGR03279 family [Caloramator proteoclasticus DSM 10124]
MEYQRKNIVVTDVARNSIAQKYGIEPFDEIISINGVDVLDTIEYRYITTDSNINIKLKKKNGDIKEVSIKKDPYEDLGIEFDDPYINNPRRCSNKCIFCFIDQLPKGMRDTLYFKDDDSRLSFLQGNFITLTNMKDEDIDRIIRFKISPINVSVHTTNPELRVKMLNNKRAGRVLEYLKKLTNAGIKVNCQIVLCKGINDGEELERTIRDLYTMYPNISNVAVVPVGITKFREGLYPLQSFDEESAKQVIEQVEKIQNEIEGEIGIPFVRLADEFYIMANKELPNYEHYDDFEQLEDGIGMIRFFEGCVEDDIEYFEFDGKGKKFSIATGVSSYNFIKSISEKINSKFNIYIKVYPIINNFFGEKITVTGLLTGKDLIEQLKGKVDGTVLLLSSNMFKAYEDVLLDDISIDELSRILNTKIIKCKFTGEDLIENIEREVIECQSR